MVEYAEYYYAIKDALKSHLSGFRLSDKEIEEYMIKHEDIIKREYNSDKKEFESGEITLDVFKNGCVNSVAWCLRLLYE